MRGATLVSTLAICGLLACACSSAGAPAEQPAVAAPQPAPPASAPVEEAPQPAPPTSEEQAGLEGAREINSLGSFKELGDMKRGFEGIDDGDLSCRAGGCAQACEDRDASCSGGGCSQSCERGRCDFSCSGGGCSQSCAAGSSCKLSCSGGGCTQSCASARSCEGATCS